MDFGRWAMVRLRLAAAAAFLMFLRAAARCLVLAIRMIPFPVCSMVELGRGVPRGYNSG